MEKESYIDLFIKALAKRRKDYIFEVKIEVQEEAFVKSRMNLCLPNLNIPTEVLRFYNKIEKLEFLTPRKLKIYSIEELRTTFNSNVIVFGEVNGVNIGYNTSFINSAGEWDIINCQNGFIITKTLASFCTNKVWAWIDRGKVIWDDVQYK